MNTTATKDTTPAEAVQALLLQIEAVEDAIGATAVTWRQLAANPGAAAQAVERMAHLERQRELLRAALADAEQAQAQQQVDGSVAQFKALAAEAHGRLVPLLERRVQMGQELAATVAQVAGLVQGLYDLGGQIVRACDVDVAKVSGLNSAEAARFVNTEDLHSLIGQVLGRQLGRLWPEEIAPASAGVRIADRIEREAAPVLAAFRRGVVERAAALAAAGAA